jgi:hypothetical protein
MKEVGTPMKYIEEPPKRVPVAKEVDVTVVGGGVAGISAAIAAARNGAETLLIERYGVLGGTATIGLMGVFMGWNREAGGGLPAEILDRVLAEKAGYEHPQFLFDPEAFKLISLNMVRENNVKLMLYSFVSNAIVENSLVKGVIVENKSGRQAILSNIVIDASGDGDAAARAGAPFELGRPTDGLTQAVSVVFCVAGVDTRRFADYVKSNPDEAGVSLSDPILIIELDREIPLVSIPGLDNLIAKARERGEYYPATTMWVGSNPNVKGECIVNATHVAEVNAVDADELTNADTEARSQVPVTVRFLRKYVPGFEKCSLSAVASSLGVRETRRIIGDYVLTGHDVMEGRTFPDAVARNACDFDIHAPAGALDTWGVTDQRYVGKRTRGIYDIPYRCLTPKSVEGILVAGRCISADHYALSSVRSMPGCMATGQAAGTAAALAARRSIMPRQIDVTELRRILIQQGVRL